jgi:hypothetical protein
MTTIILAAVRKLEKRLTKARHGSRELDADFYEALGHRVKRQYYWKCFDGTSRRWCALPNPSTDIKDAIREVRARVPGWHWYVADGDTNSNMPVASVWQPERVLKTATISRSVGGDEALALLLALTRALIGQST